MKEYKFDNAIVRIYGEVNRENLEEAIVKFMQNVEKYKQKNKNK